MTDALAMSRAIFAELAGYAGEPTIAMRAWTGETWGPVDAPATIVLQHPGALRALFIRPNDLATGEAYIFNDIDLEGSILAAVEFATRLESLRDRRLRLLSAAPRKYDHVSPALDAPGYVLRLDASLRCAFVVRPCQMTPNGSPIRRPYFRDTALSLMRKLRTLPAGKLDLRPGQRMLDIGCGWGALAIHAAQHFGVEVLGVTLSAPQAELATIRAQEAMVEDRVEFRVLDYREVQGPFDAVSSVGMFEHVGRRKLGWYFSRVAELLEPDGVFLNHGIVTRDRRRTRTTPTFLNTYVFPDSALETVDDVVGRAEDERSHSPTR